MVVSRFSIEKLFAMASDFNALHMLFTKDRITLGQVACDLRNSISLFCSLPLH